MIEWIYCIAWDSLHHNLVSKDYVVGRVHVRSQGSSLDTCVPFPAAVFAWKHQTKKRLCLTAVLLILYEYRSVLCILRVHTVLCMYASKGPPWMHAFHCMQIFFPGRHQNLGHARTHAPIVIM